jgi:phosphate starvation-inducible PhoH-like protein
LELSISIQEGGRRGELFGPGDQYLRMIRSALGVVVSARDSVIRINGPAHAVGLAATVLDQMQQALAADGLLAEEDVAELIASATKSNGAGTAAGAVDVFVSSVHIVPKTDGQKEYLEAINKNDLTLCLGPAGTGKTYLAVAVAVSLLKHRHIKRLVLVRPAVEAGERLGFLPGDLQAKVNPYLRPLFDAMHDMMSFDQIKQFMQNDVIEVIPLAYMRGRTLNHACIILDEAQNSTVGQMLMFLTRLGHNSKMIVTGDESQIDLPPTQTSGLVDAWDRLSGLKGVGRVKLKNADIVRHKLVSQIVDSYKKMKPL